MQPSFIVLYRWKLCAGAEDAFVEAWSRISVKLRDERGSLGSRLHCGSDGIWYSYAQWPNAQQRDKAFAMGSVDSEAALQMKQAIAEELPELVLDMKADFIFKP
jgi:Antibiotic biosynthesis monooxygenase